MEKKILSVFLCCFLLLIGGQKAWAIEEIPEEIQLIMDNQLYVFPETMSKPEIINDRVYVPLRAVSEGLRCPIAWHEDKYQVAFGEPLNNNIENTSGLLQIVIYGEILATDAGTGSPFITETGTTMVPLRVVAESLNCDVLWQDYVVIITPKPVIEDIPEQEVVDKKQEFVDLSENIYDLTIMGDSLLTAEEIKRFLREKEPTIREMMETKHPEVGYNPIDENLVDLYLNIGAKYGIRGDLAFCQAIKETGYFQFYGGVKAFQNNFCGLGATGTELTGEEPLNGVDSRKAMYLPGMHGLTFTTAAYGVEAHIQHLYAYTTTAPLPAGCELVDPRLKYVQRGIAPRWIDLNGRWAVPGNNYGQEIISNYWQQIRLMNE